MIEPLLSFPEAALTHLANEGAAKARMVYAV